MVYSTASILGISFVSSFVLFISFGLFIFCFRRWIRGPLPSKENECRLDGKVVIITGGNCGIGKETAKDCLSRGATVYILCRSLHRGAEAAKELKEFCRYQGSIHVRSCDLGSFDSIISCVSSLSTELRAIHFLVCNAGVMMTPYCVTKEGFELQFGINHLGHFLLTTRLLPLLLSSTSETRPRVIVVSSLAHERGSLLWNDLNWRTNSWNTRKAYAQSKLANVLFAKGLARRCPEIGVYALHPGVINTNLGRHLRKNKFFGILLTLLIPFLKTPFHGAQTSLYCILEPSLESVSGLYYSDCREKTPASEALSQENQDKLWTLSEELIQGVLKDKVSDEIE